MTMRTYSEYEANRNAGRQIAREVSAILHRAGFTKASRYTPYGRQRPGYLCAEIGNGTRDVPTAIVFAAGYVAQTADANAACYRDAIEATGRFDVSDVKAGMITVTRKGK